MVGIVIVLAAAFGWWHFVWQDPRRVFEDMLVRNLATTSVTRTVNAGNAAQGVSQTVRLLMGPTNAADWVVTARQNGTTVATESIGVPASGYIRYTQIATGQKKNGAAYDFSRALNIWGKSDGKTDTSLSSLFAQTLLDISNAPIPPIANLTADQREKLLQFMNSEQIFAPDYTKTKTEAVNGRTVYTYQVGVHMVAYVRLMQAFAHDFGFKYVDTIDPSQYAALPPLQVSMSVDPSSHQLVRISYAATGFTQNYTDWGSQTSIAIPAHTISTTELQGRLQSVGASHS